MLTVYSSVHIDYFIPQLAQTVVYVLSLQNSSLKMSIYQMTYGPSVVLALLSFESIVIAGIGALVSPLSSTRFAALPRWSFHFLISLGLAVLNIISLVLVFRFKRLKGHAASPYFLGFVSHFVTDIFGDVGPVHVVQDSGSSSSSENHYLRILRLKIVHIFALFLFAYVGVEVTIGGMKHVQFQNRWI